LKKLGRNKWGYKTRVLFLGGKSDTNQTPLILCSKGQATNSLQMFQVETSNFTTVGENGESMKGSSTTETTGTGVKPEQTESNSETDYL